MHDDDDIDDDDDYDEYEDDNVTDLWHSSSTVGRSLAQHNRRPKKRPVLCLRVFKESQRVCVSFSRFQKVFTGLYKFLEGFKESQ